MRRRAWGRVLATVGFFALCLLAALVAQWCHAPAAALQGRGALDGGLIVEYGRFEPLVAQVEQTFKPIASRARGSYSAECNITANETCPFEDMPRGNITAVFPGEGTRCIFGTSPPYLFQVIPGDKDKLVVHFDMGGACWDEATANAGLCLSGVAEVPREGMFRTNDPANPYANYTIVVVGYCSGDAFVGNVRRDWVVPEAGDVVQSGYANTKSVVKWVHANLGKRRLKSLILTGSSAGALGVQIWARPLLRRLKYESAAVIADSFAGVFPAGVQGRQQLGVGLCNTALLTEIMQEACEAGTLEVQWVYESTMREFPEVAFASIDSKIDSVQMVFYEIAYLTLLGSADYTMSPEIFAAKLAIIYRRYNLQPNWISYMANSGNHMFLPKDILYHTRPGSTELKTSGLFNYGLELAASVELTGRDTPLTSWLADLPVRSGASASSVCRGVMPHPQGPPPAKLGGLGLWGSMLSAGVGTLAQEGAEMSGLAHCDLGQADKIFERPT